MSESFLSELLAARLGSVTFKIDGLELDFGSARLVTHVWPSVTVGSASWQAGDAGYRDALCGFIGHDVIATAEAMEAGLAVRFEPGSVIIDPATADLNGPEIAQLAIYDSMWNKTKVGVWRPGEGVFAARAWH